MELVATCQAFDKKTKSEIHFDSDVIVRITKMEAYEICCRMFIRCCPKNSDIVQKVLARVSKQAQKVIREETGLRSNQYELDEIEVDCENNDFYRSDAFIKGYFKWLLEDAYQLDTHYTIYDDHGLRMFASDAIQFFQKYYTLGDLYSYVNTIQKKIVDKHSR